MRSFEYNTPTHVVFGKDSVEKVGALAAVPSAVVCSTVFHSLWMRPASHMLCWAALCQIRV